MLPSRSLLLAIALGGAAHTLPAQSTPTFTQLHDRFVAAVGGRAALERHTSVRMTGTLTLEGFQGTVEILRARPDKFRQRTVLEGVGEIQQGFDGVQGWTIQPSGPALLNGDLGAGVKRQADWFGDITAPPEAASAIIESATFEGERAWKATYVSAEGPELSVFYSVATGLRLGYSSTTPQGESMSIQAEYKEFGGVRLPTRLTNKVAQGQVFITITDVEFDTLTPTVFALPESVRQLLKR
jgi:hypothetical protein